MQFPDIDPQLLDSPVVITCGVSGSGKTTLALALEDYDYVRLSPDELIWNLYGDDFADMPFEQQQPVFHEMGIVLESLLADMLEDGRKVVVDATMCKREKRDRMREVCSQYNVDPVIAWLDAPYNVLKKRLDKRKGSGPNDQIVADDLLIAFLANFEPPEVDENYIKIS